MSVSRNDFFKVYIFANDLATLQSLSTVPAAEGSLFGLWTSTLNPVVHVVYRREANDSERKHERVRQALADRYKMSYLGEWRVIEKFNPKPEVCVPGEFKGAPGFLVLHVAEDRTLSYLYENPRAVIPKGGSVEILKGDNPFTDDQETQNILRGTSTGHRGEERSLPTGTEAYERYRIQQPRQSRYDSYQTRNHGAQRLPPTGMEPAATRVSQWYSSTRGGEEKLKNVVNKLEKLADGKHVELTRDSSTQDVSISFKYARRDWSVSFPHDFPQSGAMVRGTNRYDRPVQQEVKHPLYRPGNINSIIDEVCVLIKR